MLVKNGEDDKKAEAQFSPEEASIVLRAALVDPLGGECRIADTQAQGILLQMARNRGMEIDEEDLDYATSYALEEVRDALTFVFELQAERKRDFYNRFVDPKSQDDELVITQIVKAYLLHKSTAEPEYHFRFDISRWADEMDEINDSFVDYLRAVNWQSFYETEIGPLSRMFMVDLPDLLESLDSVAQGVLGRIHEEVEGKAGVGNRHLKPLDDRDGQTLIDILEAVTRKMLEDALGKDRDAAQTAEECFAKLAAEPYLNPNYIRYFSEEFKFELARYAFIAH